MRFRVPPITMGNLWQDRVGFCAGCKPVTGLRGLPSANKSIQHGVPFSEYFSDVHPRLGFPLRTTLAAFAFSCIYGLLYLASTTAFNSIVTSAVLFLNITYAIPQGILLYRNREEALPPRYLNLGLFGYVCNIFSCTWIFVLIVFICMPPRVPVEVGSMNYTSVVLVGLVSIVFVLWFVRGKSRFHGPNIDWGLLQRANRVVAHIG